MPSPRACRATPALPCQCRPPEDEGKVAGGGRHGKGRREGRCMQKKNNREGGSMHGSKGRKKGVCGAKAKMAVEGKGVVW